MNVPCNILKKFGEVVGEMKIVIPGASHYMSLVLMYKTVNKTLLVKSRPKYCHRIDIGK